MSDLGAFTMGFHHGWNGLKRKTNQGATYLRAYARGQEARQREDNQGEDTRPRQKRTA